jgi:HipA-like C-terminal domain
LQGQFRYTTEYLKHPPAFPLDPLHLPLKADGYYNAGYRDLTEVIKHILSQPGHDLHKLYRQMVFNTMIGNTDDHLKNFIMLHDDNGVNLTALINRGFPPRFRKALRPRR